MSIEELLNKLNINLTGNQSKNSYIIDIPNSDEYGRIYSKLDKSDIVEEYEENQMITEQGSSLMYEVVDEDYIINLIADWSSDRYQLIINQLNIIDKE